METQFCRKRKTTKGIDEFGKRKKNVTGHSYVCKSCRSIDRRRFADKIKQYKETHRDYFDEKYRSRNLARYGMTIEDYED